MHCISLPPSRFLIYIALPWPDGKQPYLELNIFVGLVGAGVVLLPFYLISFLFKIGNLANDGYKLGFQGWRIDSQMIEHSQSFRGEHSCAPYGTV